MDHSYKAYTKNTFQFKLLYVRTTKVGIMFSLCIKVFQSLVHSHPWMRESTGLFFETKCSGVNSILDVLSDIFPFLDDRDLKLTFCFYP